MLAKKRQRYNFLKKIFYSILSSLLIANLTYSQKGSSYHNLQNGITIGSNRLSNQSIYSRATWDSQMKQELKLHQPFLTERANRFALPDTNGMTLIGKWWHGSCESVAVIDSDHVAIGNGQLLQILRIFDHGQPRVIGEVAVSGKVFDLTIRGRYAYVVNGGILDVVDITNFTQPVVIQTWSNGTPYRLVQADKRGWDFLYLGGGSLTVLSISTPGNPQLVTSEAIYQYIWWDMKQYMSPDSGLFLYAQNSEGVWFDVFNLTDPANPTRRAIEMLRVYSFAVTDHYLFVNNAPFITVFDITDPMMPDSLTRFILPGFVYDMTVAGDSLYAGVSGTSSWLYTIDITNPDIPMIRDSLLHAGPGHYLTAPLRKIVTLDQRLFLSTTLGLWGIEVQQPGLATSFDFPTGYFFAERIICAGNRAYLAYGWSGLWILDITDVANPFLLGNLVTDEYAKDILITDSVAFVRHPESIMAVDITDPGQPVAISTLPGLPDVKYGHRMALRSEYLYAASDSGILIIDVQDPANISLAGVYPLEKTAYMTIKDSLLLVTKGLSPYSPENGLHILNISTPQSPVKIGAYTQWAGARLMDVKQNYAFIETICILGRPACNALSIVDITAPTAPLEIGRKDSIFSDSHGDMGDLNVTNDWAYHTFTSTRIIYIHDPQSPVVISKIEGLFAMDVCLASPRGDIIYVGHGPGISIYRNNETTFIDQKPEGSIVSKLNLKQNYPNPFNNTTNIAFSLPRRDHAVLKIYDITGKEVITLVNKELSAGEHTTTWTGINDTGKKVSSGLYIYKLKLRYSEVSQVKKLLFLK